MTEEQNAAFTKLRSLAAPFRFRVVADGEGWPIIPGGLGRIEHFDDRDLAVYTDRPRMFTKVWSVPGVRRYQTGDTEIRALFPPDRLLAMAAAIRARRRRAQTCPASLGNLRPRVTSGLQDAPEGVFGGRNTPRVAGRARRPAKSLCTPAGAGA